jgi:hypothetical protein
LYFLTGLLPADKPAIPTRDYTITEELPLFFLNLLKFDYTPTWKKTYNSIYPTGN